MQNNGFSSEEIKEQVSKILASPQFQNSTILTRFLSFIVEQALVGNEIEIKEYTIALKVLSRPSNFNPQFDGIVRIHAGRLRRTLQEYYLEQGKNDHVMITIPKGRYLPKFSIHHDGQESTTSIVRLGPVRIKTTVAVLPFRITGNDAASASFADGLSDQISTELTSYSELSVISYYSSRSIVSKVSDVREAGLMLDAKYILTGSVQNTDTHLRIQAALIVCETRQQIWAQTFERPYLNLDLFKIQGEIAWQVVSQTAGNYGAIARNISKRHSQGAIHDVKIYDAIFWFYNFVNNISEEMFYAAEDALAKAVQMEPEYAHGWAVLGEVFIGGYFMGFKSRIAANQLLQAIENGKKSKKLDPLCQHAYQTLGIGHLFLHNKKEALRAVDEWQKIKPGAAGIKGGMGFVLICCGEYDKGYAMLEESIQLNPYYPWWFNGGISFYHFNKEQYEDAIYWIEKMNVEPVAWESIIKICSFYELDRIQEAHELALQVTEKFPYLKHNIRSYVGAFFQDEKLISKILLTLHKAGIKAGELAS